MALNVGSIYVDFEINSKKAENSLLNFSKIIKLSESEIKKFSSESTNNLNKLTENFSKLENNTNKLKNSFSILAESLKAITIAIGSSQFAKLGIDLEKTEVAFKVLTGSIDNAKNLINELNQFANFTPFDNQEIIQTAKSLLSFGFSIEEITSNLKILGDISAGTGQKINDLAYIFGQVRVAGKLQTEELNQLLERGVPILTALSNYFNITESEVKDFVSQGNVSFEDFRNALSSLTEEGGLFFNMMGEQSETTGGKISTLAGTFNDALSKLSYLIIQGLKPFLDILIPITQSINDLITAIKNWYDNLSNTDKRLLQIASAVAILFAAISLLAPFITSTLIPAIIGLAATLSTSIASSLTALNAALGPIGWAITGIIALITILIIKFNDWKNVLNPFIDFIKKLGILSSLKEVLSYLKNAFASFFDGIKNLLPSIDSFSSKFSILNVVLRSIVASFITGYVVLIAFGTYLKNLADIAIDTFTFIVEVANSAWEAIRKGSFDKFKKDSEKAFEDFKNKTISNTDDIKNVIYNAANTIKNIWAEVFKEQEKNSEEAKNIATKNIDDLVNSNQKTLDKAKAQFNSFKNEVINAISEVLNEFSNIAESLSNIPTNINFVGVNFGALSNFGAGLGKFLSSIQDFMNGIFKALDSVINAFMTLQKISQQTINNILNWVNYFYDSQINALDEYLNNVKQQIEEEKEFYKNHYDDLRSIYQNHLNELELMNNKEYLQRKQQLEQQYEEQKRRDQEEFERRRTLLEQSSVDSEQYYANLQILREDFARLQEERERELKEALSNLQNEMNSNRVQKEIELNQQLLEQYRLFNEEQWALMSEEERRQAFLNAIKEQQQKKEEELNNRKIEEENRVKEQKRKLEKEKLLIGYMAELQSFNMQKLMQILQLRIQMMTSIVQIWSGLLSAFAAIPFGLGIPIAIGLATGLSAMVQGMYAQAIGMVSAMPPPPPPVGLQTGGVLNDGTGLSGDRIPAMLANNEAVIDAKRTEKLFNFIDTMPRSEEQKKNVNIIFEPQSIYIQGVVDEKMIDNISYIITRRIQTSLVV